MSRALIVLDGLGDRADPASGRPTPLESARTPNLDRIAGRGSLGQVVVVAPGVAPESDAGALALLGIDPRTESPGRGVLEALGAGLDLRPGDIALRLNFATSDGTGRIVDSRVGRSLTSSDGAVLARALTEADLLAPQGVQAEVRSTVGHRGVLRLRPVSGPPLSAAISNSDPFYEKVGGAGQARPGSEPRIRSVQPLDGSAAARRSAELVDRFVAGAPGILAGAAVNARRARAGQPIANTVLVRAAGAVPEGPFRGFRDRTGLAGAAVTEMPVERGIARWLGLRDLFVGPMGPDKGSALAERARMVAEALRTDAFVYVHLKGPDEPGHDGDFDRKRDIIEGLDRAFFGPFLETFDASKDRIAVTADHATPCALKAHSDDPVPLLLFGAGIGRSDSTADRALPKFGEAACRAGAIGTCPGARVLPLLLS